MTEAADLQTENPVDALLLEIGKYQTAADVANNVNVTALAVRSGGFRILLSVSEALAERPEQLDGLLTACRRLLPEMDMRVVEALARQGREEVALLFLEKGFSDADLPHENITRLGYGINTALRLKKGAEAQRLIDALFARLESGDEPAREIIQVAYCMHRDLGLVREADELWNRLFAARPGDKSLWKKRRRFLSEMRSEVLESGETADGQPADDTLPSAQQADDKGENADASGSSEPLDQVVVHRNVGRTVSEWLAQADTDVSAGRHDMAVPLCMALIKSNSAMTPQVLQTLEKLASKVPHDDVCDALQMEDMLRTVPGSADCYNLLARKIHRQFPASAEKIRIHLYGLAPYLCENTLELSKIYIRQKKFAEAVVLWLPLKLDNARKSARCATYLLHAGQFPMAERLFAEIAKVYPLALLECGYDYYASESMSNEMLACLGPLLPKGDEPHIDEYQIFAVQLSLRHGYDPKRTRDLVEKLVAGGALQRERAEKICATENILEQRVRSERDEEIEAYLMKHMPDLRSHKFFTALGHRPAALKSPGRRTNRAARSVLQQPGRMHVPESHDPKPRPKN